PRCWNELAQAVGAERELKWQDKQRPSRGSVSSMVRRFGNLRISRLASSLDLGEIGDRARRLADLIEELEPVFAQALVVDIDGYLGEEGVNAGPQFGHGAHGGGKFFFRQGGGCVRLGGLDRLGELFFFGLLIKLRRRRAGIVGFVFLLFDANDMGGPPITAE